MFDRFAWHHRARRVLSLLAEERAMIRTARILDLAALAARRDRLVDDLAAGPARPEPEAAVLLERIRAEAARNQRLLAALLEGMQAATQELARLRRAGSALGLYTPTGARLPNPDDERRMADRRA